MGYGKLTLYKTPKSMSKNLPIQKGTFFCPIRQTNRNANLTGLHEIPTPIQDAVSHLCRTGNAMLPVRLYWYGSTACKNVEHPLLQQCNSTVT